jgi:uncharacterized membrane protein
MGSKLTAPIIIIAVSIPLILRMIPRNGWYGFRVPKTLASDQVWYPANQAAGIALLLAGCIWLAAAFGAVPPRYVTLVGMSAIGGALLVSFLYLRTL